MSAGQCWTPDEDARLRELYPCTPTRDLPALFGRTRTAIKVRAGVLGLRKTPDGSVRHPWHPDEDAVLRQLYPDTPAEAIAAQLGRTLVTTYARARKLGISKSEAFLASPASGRLTGRQGAATRYAKGNVPANKGRRRPGWAAGRMKETQFAKGQRARNWRPIGSERVAMGYRFTKVADERGVPWTKNWRQTHQLLWEQHHGPVPRTHALVFKNGDRADIRIENLELITRQELMLRNTIHNLPAPLPQTIQLLGALNRKINRRRRHGEEQDRRSA